MAGGDHVNRDPVCGTAAGGACGISAVCRGHRHRDRRGALTAGGRWPPQVRSGTGAVKGAEGFFLSQVSCDLSFGLAGLAVIQTSVLWVLEPLQQGCRRAEGRLPSLTQSITRNQGSRRGLAWVPDREHGHLGSGGRPSRVWGCRETPLWPERESAGQVGTGSKSVVLQVPSALGAGGRRAQPWFC